MRWRGRERSGNVEDRRGYGASMGGGRMAGALPFLLIRFVMSRFGFAGVAVLIGGYFLLQFAGIDPLQTTAPQSGGRPAAVSERSDDQFAFASVVLAETEAVWAGIFDAAGENYPEPTLVVFTGEVVSACGGASAAAGPFYCPADRRIYLDTAFFDALAQRFGAPGDFAAAYVIAHEVGHHVQSALGVLSEAQRRKTGLAEAEANAVQVRVELQADCYAGIWAHHAERTAGLLEPGDIEEGLRAAAAIGDDTLQRQAGRRVTPESFTHGSSEQRVRWFTTGYRSGDPRACDTFS